MGDDGKLVAGMYGQNPRLLDEAKDAAIRAKPPEPKYPRVESVYAEWIAACKGGAPAGSSFAEHSGPLTEMVLLGVLGVRMGRSLELNPQTGQITNVRVPEEWIRPTPRKGWSLGDPSRAAGGL